MRRAIGLFVREDAPGIGDIVRFGKPDLFQEGYVVRRLVSTKDDSVSICLGVATIIIDKYSLTGLIATGQRNAHGCLSWATERSGKPDSPIELEIVRRANL